MNPGIVDQVASSWEVGRLLAPSFRGEQPLARTLTIRGVLAARLLHGKIKIYPVLPHTRYLNRFLAAWAFNGRFIQRKEQVFFTERWPFPDVLYFAGMQIDPQGRVLNGCASERTRQRELTRLLGNWYLYLVRHPVPAPDPTDCPFCRGVRTPAEDRATLFDDWNHWYRHLKSGFLNGTMIDNALREDGYGAAGRTMLRGEQDDPSYGRIFRAVRAYVYCRAGIGKEGGRG